MTESHLQSHTTKAVHVSAPSRLHFGLLSFGNQEGRNFGGVGLMLKEPRVEITATPADEFATQGPYAERLLDFAQQWQLYTPVSYTHLTLPTKA